MVSTLCLEQSEERKKKTKPAILMVSVLDVWMIPK